MNPHTTTSPSTAPHSIALVGGRFVPSLGESVDSVLLAGGRIEALGTARNVLALASRETQVLELGKRIVTAGFQDGHMHFLSMGIRAAHPDLSGSRTLEEALDAVRAAVTKPNTGDVVIAEGWDETKWTRADRPTRDALDHLERERPVVMRRVCGHAAVGNSAALRAITSVAGDEGVDAASGLLLERPALSLDVLFAPSVEQADAAIDVAARLCLERGITTGCDFLRPGDGAIWARRLARGELPLRIHAYLVEADTEKDGLADFSRARRTFFLEGTKIFADGSIGARTAALDAPYRDRPESTGQLLLDADDIASWIARAHRREMALAVHAIGDRAIAAVLDAFSRFDPQECRARRHRIEHLELPRSGDGERLAALGVRPCMQPNFVAEWGFPGGLYERALGPARVERMNPLASVHRAGCGLFFGSDGMPLTPLYGVRAAMTHPSPSERLDEADAVARYTQAPAEAFGSDPDTGRIAQGSAADLCVLPHGFDWRHADAATRTDLTIVAGCIVHRSAAFPAAAARSLAA